MKLRELLERIELKELADFETEIDLIFAKYGIDISFTAHFKERMNDERNIKPITIVELKKIFKDTYDKYGKEMSMGEETFEAVLKDLSSKINIPFVLKGKTKKTFVSKTIMRKKNFGTPNPVYEV